MKKILLLLCALGFTHLAAGQALAWDVFQACDKVIFINQPQQLGTAYEHGKKVMEFQVLTGDDECPTNPGIYIIRMKIPGYYSNKFDTPMPFSMFFDWPGRKAIHEGGVPGRAERAGTGHPRLHSRGAAPYRVALRLGRGGRHRGGRIG